MREMRAAARQPLRPVLSGRLPRVNVVGDLARASEPQPGRALHEVELPRVGGDRTLVEATAMTATPRNTCKRGDAHVALRRADRVEPAAKNRGAAGGGLKVWEIPARGLRRERVPPHVFGAVPN